jgi:hypothetical protein
MQSNYLLRLVVGAVVAQSARSLESIKANVPLSAGDDDAH